jgi:hypothetical protein
MDDVFCKDLTKKFLKKREVAVEKKSTVRSFMAAFETLRGHARTIAFADSASFDAEMRRKGASWRSDSACSLCGLVFTNAYVNAVTVFVSRSAATQSSAHHCRFCGRSTCDSCSAFRITVGTSEQAPLRACRTCFTIFRLVNEREAALVRWKAFATLYDKFSAMRNEVQLEMKPSSTAGGLIDGDDDFPTLMPARRGLNADDDAHDMFATPLLTSQWVPSDKLTSRLELLTSTAMQLSEAIPDGADEHVARMLRLGIERCTTQLRLQLLRND